MNGMAASLKDEDIRELAAYFAKQGPSLWVPLPGSAVAAR
jgi:cytochrome c553